MVNKAIDTGHSVVISPESIEGKDINEMVMSGISPSEISDIISSNTFNGITAKLKFNMWKKL